VKSKTALAALALAASALVPTTATTAQAVPGCSSDVRTMMSGRTQSTYFVEPVTGNRVNLNVTARPVFAS